MLFLALPLCGQQGMLLVGSSKEIADSLISVHPNAAAAWSFRLLSDDYTGDCVTILRASDGASSAIGFLSSGVIDTTSINSFCSATVCYAMTWNDQGGEGYDATAADTTVAPTIYQGGAIVRKGSQVSLYFDGADILNVSDIAAIAADSTNSFYSVSASTANNALGVVFNAGALTSNFAILHDRRTVRRNFYQQYASSAVSAHVANLSTTRNDANLRLLVSYRNKSTNSISGFDNGATGTTDVYTNSVTATNPTIGYRLTGPFYLTGYISELIINRVDNSSDRTEIENNINNYYSIY
ncbi:MAG: hypothetical protein KDA17_06095 [Candidatus Saccharibacteria bacterium]|nr:hypothetical protein [Candidatus Saccharibacteria bacterium]